jgi:hypothetical protein
MKANVGKADKVIRIILGAVVIAAGVVYESWLGVIGIVPIVTALINFCPLYSVLGVNTCGVKK